MASIVPVGARNDFALTDRFHIDLLMDELTPEKYRLVRDKGFDELRAIYSSGFLLDGKVKPPLLDQAQMQAAQAMFDRFASRLEAWRFKVSPGSARSFFAEVFYENLCINQIVEKDVAEAARCGHGLAVMGAQDFQAMIDDHFRQLFEMKFGKEVPAGELAGLPPPRE